MEKILKKVYLPSGLIASMYNLYGGSSKSREALNMYDIELMCSYLEYYFNYTRPSEKRYVYRFYTLPHFYKANPTDRQELKVERKEDKIKEKHTVKVIDETSSVTGSLYKVHKELKNKKSRIIEGLIKKKKFPRELDPYFGNNSGHPLTAYEFGQILEKLGQVPGGAQGNEKLGGFRISELYKIKRRVRATEDLKQQNGGADYVEVPMFDYGIYKDLSTFFILNPEQARGNLSQSQITEQEAEMRIFLKEFFSSGCYKLLSDRKIENYAPDVNTFVACFKRAVEAYNRLGFRELNREYLSQIDSAKANKVDYSAVEE